MHDDKHFGTQNASGDDQLHLDIDCDNAVFKALRQCGVVAMAASEETPVETLLSSDGIYSIGKCSLTYFYTHTPRDLCIVSTNL